MSDQFSKLLEFLQGLEANKIFYTLSGTRFNAITVDIRVPGQRWEVDFLAGGDIEVEIFESSGEIRVEKSLSKLIQELAD